MKVVNLDDFKHGVRVAELSLNVSHLLKLPNHISNKIYLSALLHDIGKAFLDQDILNKTGKLSVKEKKHINKHSYFGYLEVLRLGYNVEVALNVLYHHENYNGFGYPTGLKGYNIPIGARIIRICDVFDALLTNRPYRNGLTIDEAIKIMEDEKINFDPNIYKVFIHFIIRKYILYQKKGEDN